MMDYLAARDRPTGISILSILHLLGGIATTVLAVAALFIPRDQQVKDALAQIGIPLPLLFGGIIFLGLLGLASGIGMWTGAKWGWYLGSFWYAYAITRNLSALATVYSMFETLPPAAATNPMQTQGFYYLKFAVRLLISALIYFYFFKRNVREYFGLSETRMWKAVVAEFGICLGIVSAITAVMMMAH